MKLSKIFFFFLLSFFIYSCSDSDNDITPGENNKEAEKQINDVIDVIADDSDLSSFKNALEKVDASKFTETQFTFLAYKNKQTASLRSANSSQDDETLRHIVGGYHTFDALKKLQYIVALSKDTLFIKYSEADNSIFLNGILLGKSKVAGKSIVFVVDSVIPQALDTSKVNEIEYKFRVKKVNTRWSESNKSETLGNIKNATVTIYENDKAIKELKSDADGIVSFQYKKNASLQYVVKTDSLSMFYNGYLIKGLFTTQEEINQHPICKEFEPVIGALKFADINGDGKIDNADKSDKGLISNITKDSVVYMISNSYIYPVAEAITIDMAYDAYDDAERIFLEVDSIYSTLANRQKLSATSKILETIWDESYEAIRKINFILKNNNNLDSEDRIDLQSFRLNLHLNLSLLFGDIPLQMDDKLENISANSRNEIFDFATVNYDGLIQSMSNKDKYSSTAYLNTILINRLKGKYKEMYMKTEQAINSGAILLSDKESVVIYLLSCEAAIELGKLNEANQRFNALRNLSGEPKIEMTSTADARQKVRSYYEKRNNHYSEKYNESLIYNNIQSWSLNTTWGQYKLLPIPSKALQNNNKLIQNPGW